MEEATIRPDICASGIVQFGNDDSRVFSVTFMCNKVRFYVGFSSKDLGETGSSERTRLEKTYRRLKKKLPDGDEVDSDAQPRRPERKFTNWIKKACEPLMTEIVAKHPVTKYDTLEQYINPPTYALKLINNGGQLSASRCPVDPLITSEIHKTCRIPIAELTNCRYALVAAHSVRLIDNEGPFHHVVAEKVKLESGSEYFLKTPCLREIQTYQRIQASQKLPADLHVPYIQGLVEAYSDGGAETAVEASDNRFIVGVLLNLIDVKHNLTDAEAKTTVFSTKERKKWFDQVQYIVLKLHAVGICWGDVQPGNVVVDRKGDAWIVDMAGGYTVGFGVTDEDYDTEEGDLKGLKYLAMFMGIAE